MSARVKQAHDNHLVGLLYGSTKIVYPVLPGTDQVLKKQNRHRRRKHVLLWFPEASHPVAGQTPRKHSSVFCFLLPKGDWPAGGPLFLKGICMPSRTTSRCQGGHLIRKPTFREGLCRKIKSHRAFQPCTEATAGGHWRRKTRGRRGQCLGHPGCLCRSSSTPTCNRGSCIFKLRSLSRLAFQSQS